MNTYLAWLGAAGLLLLLPACNNDDEFFISFDKLCSLRAENICSVRVPPCCAEDARAPDCVEQETQACEMQRHQISGIESGLRYHGGHAAQKVDEEMTALEQCEPPRPVPSFFDGAIAEGDACARDTQCVTGLCGAESGVCEKADAALCPEP